MVRVVAETREEAEAVGFYGESDLPHAKAYKGTLRGVSVNTNDAPTPDSISGPGANVDVRSDDKQTGVRSNG